MTFSETDFPQLLSMIEKTVEEFDNPEFSIAVVKEIINIYHRVPVYPGIAAACAINVPVEVELKDINANQENGYLVETDKGLSIYGNVKDINDKFLIIENKKIKIEEIQKVMTINRNVLEEFWPTLIFPEV